MAEKNNENLELNDKQTNRVNILYSSVHNVCKYFADDYGLKYDMNIVGDITKYIIDTLVEHNITVHFPSVVTNEDGSQYIEEYIYGKEKNNEGE